MDSAQSVIAAALPRVYLVAMKNRFPSDRRTTWRQRFLAIASELEGATVHRRESPNAAGSARRRLLLPRTLRGIRLGCVRTA